MSSTTIVIISAVATTFVMQLIVVPYIEKKLDERKKAKEEAMIQDWVRRGLVIDRRPKK